MTFANVGTLGTKPGHRDEVVAILTRRNEQLEEAGHEPWFEPLMPPAGGEIESGLFALQAGLGGLALGYVFGRLKGRDATRAGTADRTS